MRWVWLSLAFAFVWLVGYLQLTLWIALLLHPLLLWVIVRHLTPSNTPVPKPTPIKPLLPTESCHWLNSLIKQWMGVGSTSLLPWLKDHIDLMLSQSLPTGIDNVEVVSLDFNHSLPLLDHINVLCCSVAPPPGSHDHHDDGDRDQSNVLINANLLFDASDDCAELRAHMGSKRCGSDIRLIISDLHLYGSVQLLLIFDKRVSYPFVSMVTITFKEKPQLWFSLRILKGLEITNIPFLHNWLYHYIVNRFTESLVDPGQLTVNFTDKLFHCIDNHLVPSKGVLTVTVKATAVTPSPQSTVNDHSYHTISFSLGQQKRTFDVPINAHQWMNSVSLFVCDNFNMLRLKIKRQGLLSNITLAVHMLDLATLGLLCHQNNPDNKEQSGKRYTTTVHNSDYTLVLTLQYTVLLPVSLSSPIITNRAQAPQQVAGVITICVHSVTLHDKIGSCDPYCVVSLDDREVLVTKHQSDCNIAHWDETVEIMTTDYTKTPITFELLHWSGPLSTSNLIGYNKLSLNENAQLVQHQLNLCNHSNNDVVGTMTVSVIFQPVDALCDDDPGRVGNVTDDNISISSCESKTSLKRKESAFSNKSSLRRKTFKKISGGTIQGVIELSILKARNLIPMDTTGLSNPYVEVKVGMEIVYRSRILHHTLNPEWLEHVTLNMPSADEIITVTCWDKDRVSDDFMGSLQLTKDDFVKFKTGPKWFSLQMVASGDLLLSINEMLPTIVQDHYDNITNVMATNEGDSADGSMLLHDDELIKRSHSDNELLRSTKRLSVVNPATQPNSETSSLAETSTSTSLITPPTNAINISSHDAPITARYSTVTRDIEHALRQSPLLGNRGEMRSKSSVNIIYGLAGTVLQVDGLKGDLSNIELYVKIRINCSTSGIGVERCQYGSRGRTVHKTRSIKRRSNPQWNESFSVRDVALLSNSLITVDLKSGSKVNIGTHTITLEKFFEGSLKETKWLDIGNDARLQLELSRQQHPVNRHTLLTSSLRRSSSLRSRKLSETHKI